MSPAPSHPRLLGDVGGTHARFAWQAGPEALPTAQATVYCRDHASLAEAVRAYLAAQGLPAPRAAAIGIANPVTGDLVRMTNHDWSFSIAQLRQDLGLAHLAVLNDFEALALGLPSLGAAELVAIGGGSAVAGAPCAVLGPGTGLGVSGLVRGEDGRPVALAGEGGHVTLAAADADEARVITWLQQRFGHVSAERALSGPGLVNLYDAVCALSHRLAEPLSPADVLARARSGDDAACRQALDLFCSLLGNVAGNLALTLGARGGVYIAGGVAARLADELPRSRFRERFEQKGRFSGYLAAIPTWLVHDPARVALLGASVALDRQVGRVRDPRADPLATGGIGLAA